MAILQYCQRRTKCKDKLHTSSAEPVSCRNCTLDVFHNTNRARQTKHEQQPEVPHTSFQVVKVQSEKADAGFLTPRMEKAEKHILHV